MKPYGANRQRRFTNGQKSLQSPRHKKTITKTSVWTKTVPGTGSDGAGEIESFRVAGEIEAFRALEIGASCKEHIPRNGRDHPSEEEQA